jgi:hypothetical protein
MSGCVSRKKKRELNKEEIRQCIQVFGEVINKRYDSNRMPLFDNNSLTYTILPKKKSNSRKTWYHIFSKNNPSFSENRVITYNPKMVSIVVRKADG